MYTFLFDRRSMALFLTGAGVAGILLFGAGVLVGLRINLPAAPVQVAEFEPIASFEGGLGGESAGEATGAPAGGGSASEAAPAPAEPATPETEGQAGENATLSDSKGDLPTAGEASSESAPPPSVAGLETSPALPPVDEPLEPTRLIPRAPSTDTAVAPKVASRGAGPSSAPSVRDSPYWVQIGAYSLAANAEKELAALLAEGFEAYTATIRTSSGSTLTAVRFGGYADRGEALRDARTYLARTPGREAIVRPPT